MQRNGSFSVPAAAIRPALVDGCVLAVASLVSYLLVAHGLAAIHSVSEADDKLGAMWAVVATLFVCRFAYQESIDAAHIRIVATLLSFALCLGYLLILPFHPLGLAALVGLGAVILKVVGREADIVTAGITTAVVMVVAALSPSPAWEQPILRLVDTVVGIAIGLAAVWVVRGVRPAPDTGS
ncbi:MAG TPA: FUSC family protein [Nocardioidaceae bacterium]|nr:FUSC family protein [Nocardioidaceae bacterium]